jgi:hypothetical protein
MGEKWQDATTKPLGDVPVVRAREIVSPGDGGIEIPLDKTRFRMKVVGETEDRATVIIEPKE